MVMLLSDFSGFYSCIFLVYRASLYLTANRYYYLSHRR